MIENFITNHKKLVIVLLIIISTLILYFMISVSFNTHNSTDTETSIDGMGERSTLPYSNYLYSIKYTEGSSKNDLTINAFEGYRNAAVDKLYEFGLNPTYYKITFNYENPFKKYE